MSETPTNRLMRYFVMYCARHNVTSGYGTTPTQDVCTFCQMEHELAAARAENAALRKDAERYRWLRGEQDDVVVGTDPGTVDHGATAVLGTYNLWLCGGELDEYIDAALASEQEGTR